MVFVWQLTFLVAKNPFFATLCLFLFNRSDSEILGYALDTLYNIICNDEEEEQGIDILLLQMKLIKILLHSIVFRLF